MFITLQQIKAARALLDWTQEDLANRAGLDVNRIRGYESGRHKTQVVLEAISNSFTAHGIEFLPEGVQKRKHEVRTLRGQQGFWGFYDDVYDTIREHGGDILISGVVESEFWRWLGEKRWSHKDRMDKLSNFSQKIIVKEGTLNLKASYSTTTYRTLPADQFSGVPFYLYGSKLAIINFEPEDVEVFIIDHSKVAEAYQKTFYALWNVCDEVEIGT